MRKTRHNTDLDPNPIYTHKFWMMVEGRAKKVVRSLAKPVRGFLSVVKPEFPALGAQFTGRFGEVLSDMEVFQQYGTASAPPPGTECVTIAMSMDPAARVVIAELDRKHRPTLAAGESAVYTQHGNVVHLKADGTVEVSAGGNTENLVTADIIASLIEVLTEMEAVAAAASVTVTQIPQLKAALLAGQHRTSVLEAE